MVKLSFHRASRALGRQLPWTQPSVDIWTCPQSILCGCFHHPCVTFNVLMLSSGVFWLGPVPLVPSAGVCNTLRYFQDQSHPVLMLISAEHCLIVLAGWCSLGLHCCKQGHAQRDASEQGQECTSAQQSPWITPWRNKVRLGASKCVWIESMGISCKKTLRYLVRSQIVQTRKLTRAFPAPLAVLLHSSWGFTCSSWSLKQWGKKKKRVENRPLSNTCNKQQVHSRSYVAA